MRRPDTLTDTKLLGDLFVKWLNEQRDIRAQAVLDGSAPDYAEYRARCGYLAALNDMHGALSDIDAEMKKDLEGET